MSDEPDYDRQPPPLVVDNPVSSHDLVAADLRSWEHLSLTGAAEAEVALRKRYGQEKYGTVLHVANGRDHVRDALDEVLDLAVYLRTALDSLPQEESPARDLLTMTYCDTLWSLAGLALYQHTGLAVGPFQKITAPPTSLDDVARENLADLDDGMAAKSLDALDDDPVLCIGLQVNDHYCIREVSADGWCPRHGQRKLPDGP